jgi:hypothetical protein
MRINASSKPGAEGAPTRGYLFGFAPDLEHAWLTGARTSSTTNATRSTSEKTPHRQLPRDP